MERDTSIEELIKIHDQKKELLTQLKDFLTSSDFDTINDWLQTVESKSELLFMMLEFSKDKEMTEYFNIIEGFYKNKY